MAYISFTFFLTSSFSCLSVSLIALGLLLIVAVSKELGVSPLYDLMLALGVLSVLAYAWLLLL